MRFRRSRVPVVSDASVPSSCMPTRRMTSHAAAVSCAVVASASGSPASGKTPASGWDATAGSSSARSPG